MRTFLLTTLFAGALFGAASLAQTTPPTPQNPSAPPSQPQAQPATPSEAQPATPSQPQTAPQMAQPAQRPASSANGSGTQQHRIAPGSVIPVQLTKTIDAKKAKQGDLVVAKVTMDMKTSSGEVLVPKDTKVMGHVTEAQARNKQQKESQLGIAFDRAVMKEGEMDLPMSIQAVIAPPSNNNNNANSTTGAAPAGTTPSGSPMSGGRTMAGSGQSQSGSGSPNTPPEPQGSTGTEPSQAANTGPQITGNTQGVVGISNLKLESNAAQGSLLTSEKNNVKVESGTMLLLKVK